MNVHNLMEDIVSQAVNKLYEQVMQAKASWLTCDCENCRLDTISYVLNRIPPRYVVSGRGVTHSTEQLNSSQLKADIEALSMEGMRTVSSTKRPFHSSERKDCTIQPAAKPAFNFYTFTGSILDGNTFEPVTGASILLKLDGKPAEMVDKTWSNPVTTVKSTKGRYSFWIKSQPTRKADVTKKFNFSLEITAPDYEELIYHFEVPITSERSIRNELDSTHSLMIKDLVLFKK